MDSQKLLPVENGLWRWEIRVTRSIDTVRVGAADFGFEQIVPTIAEVRPNAKR
jgi:hypothetical protein